MPSRAPAVDFQRPVHALLGLAVDACDLAGAVDAVRRAAFEGRPCMVSTPNLNFVVQAQTDAAFRDSVLASELSLPDGMPLVWTARLLGVPLPGRVAGADLFEALARHEGPPVDVYFFGGPEGAAQAACERVNATASGLRCVGFDPAGYGTVEEMSGAERIARINASGAHFVIAALGARKGQAWLQRNRTRLSAPVLCHLGAVVNFAAGRVRRAPRGLQRLGLEWLWRIVEEPALWRRYAGDAVAYARLLATRALPLMLGQALRSRRAEREAGLHTHWAGRACRIELHGAWTRDNLQPLRDELQHAAGQAQSVSISLRHCGWLDSAAVGLLLMAPRAFPGGLRLLDPSSAAMRCLRLQGAGFLLAGDRQAQHQAQEPASDGAGEVPSRGRPAELAPRVLIVSEHACARFGGEAALPLHYFRVLRSRGVPVWLVTHARTRDELQALFPGETRIRYIEDTALARLMWRIGRRLPARVAYLTVGFVSRVATQLAQRRLVRRLVAEHGIDVVHQPMPVSPREPSLMHGLGAPVVIGPMNGGMDYPPAFRHAEDWAGRAVVAAGRWSAAMLNLVMPGKRRAALLLVANRRTREALPAGVCPRVGELVENGVDLSLWHAGEAREAPPGAPVRYVFLGRLVDWKAVDLLLHALARASRLAPMRLQIVGDGVERPALETLARELGMAEGEGACVHFAGWLGQAECAQALQQADALVLPSLLECGGAVVLEAMACAKPVIATAWGGPLDYLDDSCGILVPPTDRDGFIEGLAQAMLRLARSPEERARLGHNGRDKVRRQYDWETKVDAMLRWYAQAQSAGVRSPSPRSA